MSAHGGFVATHPASIVAQHLPAVVVWRYVLKEDIMEQKQERKPYEEPEVVYESALEVRAGSPLSIPDALDLTGTNK